MSESVSRGSRCEREEQKTNTRSFSLMGSALEIRMKREKRGGFFLGGSIKTHSSLP